MDRALRMALQTVREHHALAPQVAERTRNEANTSTKRFFEARAKQTQEKGKKPSTLLVGDRC